MKKLFSATLALCAVAYASPALPTQILNVQEYEQYSYSSGDSYAVLTYQAADIYQQPYQLKVVQLGTTQDLTTTPYPTFTTADAALTYYESSQCNALISTINGMAGSTMYAGYVASEIPAPVEALFSELPTVAKTGNYSDLIGKPSPVTVPSNVSAFSNDAGYLTTSSLSGYSTTTAMNSAISAATAAIPSQYVYSGINKRSIAFPYINTGTVASGTVSFNLTVDGTTSGTAMFPNGIIPGGVNYFVNDATGSYQVSYALTNSNKTITFTANKYTTANLLSGLLGQSAANGAVLNVTIYGW